MRYIVLPVGWLALAALATGTMAAQERPAELTGCYDIAVGAWYVAKEAEPDWPDWTKGRPLPDQSGDSAVYELPPRIEFAGPFRGFGGLGDRVAWRTQIVVPEGALPSAHSLMYGEDVGDSLRLVFSTGYVGVRATLGRSGGRWAGIGSTFEDLLPHEVYARPVELIPVSCDSPPPVSIDAMLPITRSVELEGGLAITLGEPLPEALETTPARRNIVRVTGRTTGLFAGAGSVEVVVGERGVTHIWLYYADPGVHSSLESRLRDAYGVPEHMGGQTAAFLNRITSLSLARLRNGEAQVDLWDSRW